MRRHPLSWSVYLSCAACVLLCATPAFPQENDTLVTAALLASHHERGKSDSVYMCCGFGGTAPGAVVGVHLPRTAKTSIVLEGSLQSSIEERQSGRALRGGAVVSAHRDTILTGAAGIRQGNGTVTPVWVAGGSVVFRHTRRTPWPGRSNFEPYTLDDVTVGASGGLDMVIHISPRMSLVPTLRFHYVFDRDRTGAYVVKRGVGSVIWRGGFGLAVRF